jgi:hypothetical protein
MNKGGYFMDALATRDAKARVISRPTKRANSQNPDLAKPLDFCGRQKT